MIQSFTDSSDRYEWVSRMDFLNQKKKKKTTILQRLKEKCPIVVHANKSFTPFRKYERNNILIKCKIDNIWVFLKCDYVK